MTKTKMLAFVIIVLITVSAAIYVMYFYEPLDANRTTTTVTTTTTTEPPLEIKIAFYNGAGAWSDEETILSNFVEWMGGNFTSVDGAMIKNGVLDQFDVLMWPGGDYVSFWNEVGLDGKAKVQEFISNGGGYFGICAGAYYACEYMVWMDDPGYPGPEYKVEGHDLNLGLFPGVAWGPIFEIADRPEPGWAMPKIDIMDHSHAITSACPNQMTMFYYGGPYFVPNVDATVSVLGRYNQTGEVAMVACEYGSGRVFLVGPHLEIEEGSLRDGWVFPDLDPEPIDPESDWPMMQSAINWLYGLSG